MESEFNRIIEKPLCGSSLDCRICGKTISVLDYIHNDSKLLLELIYHIHKEHK